LVVPSAHAQMQLQRRAIRIVDSCQTSTDVAICNPTTSTVDTKRRRLVRTGRRHPRSDTKRRRLVRTGRRHPCSDTERRRLAWCRWHTSTCHVLTSPCQCLHLCYKRLAIRAPDKEFVWSWPTQGHLRVCTQGAVSFMVTFYS